MAMRSPERPVQLIIYDSSTVKRRKLHRVEVMHGPSGAWSTKCGWHFGRGSKSELLPPQPWGDIDKKKIEATACTSGCFSRQELEELRF